MSKTAAKKSQKQIHPTKHSRSKAKTVCKCLTCANPHREEHEGKIMLICEDEACFLRCNEYTERPVSGCGFKAVAVVGEEVQVV